MNKDLQGNLQNGISALIIRQNHERYLQKNLQNPSKYGKIVTNQEFFDFQVDEINIFTAFLNSFAELHIGEWRKYYRTEHFGYVVLDGTQWELAIEYNNGRKTFISGGSNFYPYNFPKLTELFGIEEEDEDPEADE